MATRGEDLVLRLKADSKQLTAELDKVQAKNKATTSRISSEWKSISTSLGSLGGSLSSLTGFGALAAGGLSVAGLVSLANDAQDTADTLDKLSQRLGVSTTALQEYQFAAGQAGVEQGELESALQSLAKSMGETALGTGRARKAFEALGIDIRDSSGNVRDVSSVFEELIQKLAQVGSAAERSALSRKVFGGSGAAISALAGDFDDLIARARDLRVAVDEGVVTALAETQDASEALSAQLSQRLSESMSVVSGLMLLLKEKAVSATESMVRFADAVGLLKSIQGIIPPESISSLDVVKQRIATTTAEVEKLQERFRNALQGKLLPRESSSTAVGQLQAQIREGLDELKALEAQRARLEPSEPKLPAAATFASDALSTKSKSDAAAKQAARELAAAQQELTSAIEASQTPAERLVATMDQLGELHRKGKLTAEEYAQGQEAIARSLGEIEEKVDQSAIKELNSFIEAGLTPAEKLIQKFDELAQSFATFTPEQIQAAQASFEKKLNDIQLDGMKDELKQVEQVGRGVAEGLTGAFSDFVLTGKADFASLAQSFASEILQLGIKGGLSAIFPSLGPLFGFGGAKAAGGPVTTGSAYLVGEKGPELFVPRSSGFIVPNSSNAGRGAASGSPVYVTINNNSRSDVQAQERRGTNGQREIEILVSEVVARDVARGGVVSRAIDQRLRTRPRGA